MNLIVILTSLNLILYTTHLRGTDMEIFCRNFPTSTSMPTQFMFAALVYGTAAGILVVYHKSGVYTGIVVSILSPIAFVYPVEFFDAVSQWKRPRILE